MEEEIKMTEKQQCSECQYFRLRHSRDRGIYYECTHFESDVDFDGVVCNKFTTEKDIFNIW